MYHVYLENRSVVFCLPSELPSEAEQGCIIKENGSSLLKSIAETLMSGSLTSDVYVADEDPERLMSQFFGLFRQIMAGGGVVCRDGRYLMIFRRGVWDLPKGKLEAGESIEECALREVAEETGLNAVTIGPLICVTHHLYRLNGVCCVKHTHWFSMQYDGSEEPVPQTEEEITGVEWMSMREMAEKSAASYRSIREVISNL